MTQGRPSCSTVYSRLENAINELNHRFSGLPSLTEAKFVWDDMPSARSWPGACSTT